MNYLIELSHPKHYYQFKSIIHFLQSDSTNKVHIIARDKDVLLKILEDEKSKFEVFGKHGKSIFSKLTLLPRLLVSYYLLLKKKKINVVISKASPYAAILCPFLNIKTIIFPDSEIVKITNKLVVPRSTRVITPNSYALDYGLKHKRVQGLFEDCYLHPEVFIPNEKVVKELRFDLTKPFFILRFIAWNANHDINNYGFKKHEKVLLVEHLKQYGNVYVSGEAELPEELKEYKISIPPSEIHHVLHFATMYIGDSQTMATEAALLGTPTIRYNSFVGENDMSNFKLLENEYNLMRNVSTFENVLQVMSAFLANNNNKEEWIEKRKLYYQKNESINQQILNNIKEI